MASETAAPVYAVDTSAFIRAHELNVSSDDRERLWANLLALVDTGRVCTVWVAMAELKRNMPECHARFDERREPPFIVQRRRLIAKEPARILARVLNDFPRMSGVGGQRDKADPWLVTVAAHRGLTVVTQEGSGRQQIPHACSVLQVECIDLLELVVREHLI